MPRQLKNSWVTEYLRWIGETSESPLSYHYWSAATVIAGAIKRHCWVNRGHYNLYPNLYTILVGHTGLGKGTAVNPAVSLLRAAGVANIMSDKLTIQYILEKISDRGQMAGHIQVPGGVSGGGGTISFAPDSSFFLSAPEIEDFFTMSDSMPPLKELWESKDIFEYGTRGKSLVKIIKPCPTILGGCTSSQIAYLFPTKSVGGGFSRRCNFIYESEKNKSIPWPVERNGTDVLKDKLIADLRSIAQLKGQFTFDSMAKKYFQDYYDNPNIDEFTDEATSSYEVSRPYHALKLAMALAASRYDAMNINYLDMASAIAAVDKCTADLKKVFRSVGDSDMAVVIDKVLRFIELKSKLTYVQRSDIMNAMWRDVGSSANLDVILATLEAGRVIYTESRSGITVYKIVKQTPQASQGSTTIQ